MEHSVLLSVVHPRPEQVVPFANLVAWTTASRLWFGQGVMHESHHLAAWLAGLGIRVPVGLGVSLMPLRSPYLAAIEARSLALITGQSVTTCFGPGAPELQEGVLGGTYDAPASAAAEYATLVRQLLDGQVVQSDGVFPLDGMGLPHTPGVPPIRVGLGVLRPAMARAASRVAQDAVTWLCSPSYIASTLAGPLAVSGTTPRITAVVPIAVEHSGRDAVALAERSLGQHVRQPHYSAMLRLAGIELSGQTPLTEDDVRQLIEHSIFLYGSTKVVAEHLTRYANAAVDEVVLSAIGVAACHGGRAATQDLLDVIREIG